MSSGHRGTGPPPPLRACHSFIITFWSDLFLFQILNTCHTESVTSKKVFLRDMLGKNCSEEDGFMDRYSERDWS